MTQQAEIGKAVVREESTVFVALGPRDQPYLRSFMSLENVCRVANGAGIKTILTVSLGGVYGHYNADVAIGQFMKTSATHLFFPADDLLFPQQIIIKLVEDDKDVVGAVYPKRSLRQFEPANWKTSAEEFNRRLESKGVYRVEYSSGHALLMKRRVIEKMISDHPELEYETEDGTVQWALWYPMIRDRKFYFDDWAFSIRAKESGFALWDDYSLSCPHYAGNFVGFGKDGFTCEVKDA